MKALKEMIGSQWESRSQIFNLAKFDLAIDAYNALHASRQMGEVQ